MKFRSQDNQKYRMNRWKLFMKHYFTCSVSMCQNAFSMKNIGAIINLIRRCVVSLPVFFADHFD